MPSTNEPAPLQTLPPPGGGKREIFWTLFGAAVCAALLTGQGHSAAHNLARQVEPR